MYMKRSWRKTIISISSSLQVLQMIPSMIIATSPVSIFSLYFENHMIRQQRNCMFVVSEFFHCDFIYSYLPAGYLHFVMIQRIGKAGLDPAYSIRFKYYFAVQVTGVIGLSCLKIVHSYFSGSEYVGIYLEEII